MRNKRSRSNARRFWRWLWWLVIIVLIAGGGVSYVQPVPRLVASVSYRDAASAVVAQPLAWPASGSAAVGAAGFGVLASHGSQTAEPTASVAKLITVLTVLQKYPLQLNQSGPTLTMTAADVTIWQNYVAEDGSNAAAAAGEQISEYQVLQAILLPSANNMADSLAIWAFGSLPAYRAAANKFLAAAGLTHTTVGSDASGFLPDTVSTPDDLVKLGLLVLQNPVLAQIVDQPSATIPVAGTIYNVNSLLGQDGIIGIKTGNTDQAGGVYVFAADDTLDSTHSVTIVGAVQGVPTLAAALAAAPPLLDSAKADFKLTTIVSKGQTIGQYAVPWSQPVNAVAADSLTAATWLSTPRKPIVALRTLRAPAPQNTKVGSLQLTATGTSGTSTPIVLQHAVPAPSIFWRIIGRHV